MFRAIPPLNARAITNNRRPNIDWDMLSEPCAHAYRPLGFKFDSMFKTQSLIDEYAQNPVWQWIAIMPARRINCK